MTAVRWVPIKGGYRHGDAPTTATVTECAALHVPGGDGCWWTGPSDAVDEEAAYRADIGEPVGNRRDVVLIDAEDP